MDFSQFKTRYGLHLDPQQEAAVQTVDGPVLLLAVPGSGKTTVLVSRIGYMLYVRQIPPESILTMTYTVSAARDMQARFASFFGEQDARHLEFRTINGVCSRIIRLYEQTMGRRAFDLLDDPKERNALLAELCRRGSKEFATESTINALETAITYVKNQMLSEEELQKVNVEGIDFPPIYKAYCEALRSRRLMDYDDQMVYALQILRQYPQILEAVQNRYRYFCVDEAQDTSKIQHYIIRLLAGKSRELFMVGDEDQSIYGFRAAYPQALTEFDKVYPRAKILYMEQNYRSTREIVSAADRFIQKNKDRHPKHMKATRGSGPAIEEISVYDRQRQYRYLCEVARGCKQDTAVLYRDNDSALPLIDLLDRAGIPYRSRQVNSAFFTNRVVRDITDILRLALDPKDGDRFLAVYYKLGAGISKLLAQAAVSYSRRTGEEPLAYISQCSEASPWTRKQCRSLQTHMQNMRSERGDKAVYRIVHFMGYGEYLEQRGIDPIRADILEALGAEQPTPRHLLSRLDELKTVVESGSAAKTQCPFVLSTIHSSKGLEYDRVFLMDVLDGLLPGLLPDSRSTEEERDAYEEERRLFYVGMTRAREELHLFTFKKAGLRSSFAEELFPPKPSKSTSPRPAPKPEKPTRKLTVSSQKIAAADKDCIPGAEVVHKTFGPGRILARNGDIVTVAFQTGDSKRISRNRQSCARIERHCLI